MKIFPILPYQRRRVEAVTRALEGKQEEEHFCPDCKFVIRELQWVFLTPFNSYQFAKCGATEQTVRQVDFTTGKVKMEKYYHYCSTMRQQKDPKCRHYVSKYAPPA